MKNVGAKRHARWAFGLYEQVLARKTGLYSARLPALNVFSIIDLTQYDITKCFSGLSLDSREGVV